MNSPLHTPPNMRPSAKTPISRILSHSYALSPMRVPPLLHIDCRLNAAGARYNRYGLRVTSYRYHPPHSICPPSLFQHDGMANCLNHDFHDLRISRMCDMRYAMCDGNVETRHATSLRPPPTTPPPPPPPPPFVHSWQNNHSCNYHSCKFVPFVAKTKNLYKNN